ncbi:NAD(P)H-hydrate dehydratase [Luteimonas sp. MC1572]|uniref:NAD(P)H-hydrate dehydratase n=1 Tax=Luteimonas sp. MC1572 TaxID=2799325 RepID=UPI0018F0E004|nr:NAD(P)H-hydrate dehydratase [Luteimonas sp. MC1572]MBJ6982911.1 NAD(P)H-hydrate dehydratase [Luteimonas sp. MC1572]QQO04134.1 NAD(P)H-hydrate dehydratase [Luteimonas sp. MC1572]
MDAPATIAGTPLHDIAAVRLLEARAIAALGGDAFELMCRAGVSAWRFALRHWPQAQRVLVLCGPGNNGGDGYVFARHALESGREVRVLHAAGHEARSPLALRARADYEAAGGRVDVAGDVLPGCDLVVDALFGIGLGGAPDATTAALLEAIDALDADVLSLDVPSGIYAARGDAAGAAVHATRTLQFLAEHAGLRSGHALEYTGALALATLDIPGEVRSGVEACARLLSPTADVLAAALPPRRRNAHKGDSGHVLVVGGDHGTGGAVIIAAAAALRAGAGLVSVATREAHVSALLARAPEAMAHGGDDPDAWSALCAAASVCAVGPGLGRTAWARRLLDVALASGTPLVLDADALNLLAEAPRVLPPSTIVTPHPGEAARLLGSTAADVQGDRFGAVRALRERLGCVVVLKGAGTLVAAPGRDIMVIDAGNPGMAVGGMGDALTGVVAALCAQGHVPADAAALGALLHGVAGDRAAAEGGARGLLPSDLIDALRRSVNP